MSRAAEGGAESEAYGELIGIDGIGAAAAEALIHFEAEPHNREMLDALLSEIEIEDELRFDNRRFLALMAAPPWKVLIVDGQPHDIGDLSVAH